MFTEELTEGPPVILPTRFDDGDTDLMAHDKTELFVRYIRTTYPQVWANAMLAIYAPEFHATKRNPKAKGNGHRS
jgi:hypothetical protein